MTIHSERLLQLWRSLTDDDPVVRRGSANSVTDIRVDLDDGQGRALSYMLAILATCEDIDDAREAQLHALADLHEWGKASADAIEALRQLNQDTLAGSETEYVAYLLGSA